MRGGARSLGRQKGSGSVADRERTDVGRLMQGEVCRMASTENARGFSPQIGSSKSLLDELV